jgi:hypothetical protein
VALARTAPSWKRSRQQPRAAAVAASI